MAADASGPQPAGLPPTFAPPGSEGTTAAAAMAAQTPSPIPVSTPPGSPADPAAGLWDCKLGNSASRPRYALTLSVAADKRITVLTYNSAQTTVVNADPLTFTATNPRGNRLTTFIWNSDNSMSVTGPRSSDPSRTFHNVGSCVKG